MVAAAFDFRTIRLGEYRSDLILVQTAYFWFGCLFSRDTQYLTTLPRRQGFSVGHEDEETAERSETAVPCPNRYFPFLFGVLQEGQDLRCGEIRQPQPGNRSRFPGRYEP